MVEQQPVSRHKIALALQGGGSHGAFTWGVLDRILSDPTIEIIGVTGTSAGAMNAAALVGGLLRGGAPQARAGLRRYWEAVGAGPGFGSLFPTMSGSAAAMTPLESIPAYVDLMSKSVCPYDLPSSANPLRALFAELIDFDHLRLQEDIQLVLSATNVRTSQRRIFTNRDVCVDAVLASACLPQLFRAVEIDGESYWDGGWTGNPALIPLVRKMPDCDLIIIRIDPLSRPEVPHTLHDIFERSTEISFNSVFWLELGALAAMLRVVDQGLVDRARFGRIRFHKIEANSIMERFPMSSKRNNYPPLLEYLFALGRETADAWMVEHRADLGRRSTMDFKQLLAANADVWKDF
jgi:NTE family protein